MEETMKADEKKFRFLIDGFPRNQDNLQGWNTVMDGKADVKFVLFFDCSNEVRSSWGFKSVFNVFIVLPLQLIKVAYDYWNIILNE